MTDAIEVYEREDGRYGFRVKAGNNEIVAASQGYNTEGGARRGADALVRAVDRHRALVAAGDSYVEGVEFHRGPDGTVVVVSRKDGLTIESTLSAEQAKQALMALNAAVNNETAREAYLITVIDRHNIYGGKPPNLDQLTQWVKDSRGVGVNPFMVEGGDLRKDVSDTVVDLFFQRKIQNERDGVVVTPKARG